MKSCENCLFEEYDSEWEPCLSCYGKSNWKNENATKRVKKVRVFNNIDADMLEFDINMFANVHEIVDIKYQFVVDDSGRFHYSALVIYVLEVERERK